MGRLLGFVVMVFSLLCIGCGGEETPGSTTTKKVFKYNQPTPVTSLDPAFARNQSNIWAVDHVFSSLLEFDEGLNIKPLVASSWTISEDGLTYTFTLRDDVFFHDNACFPEGKGRKVVASDFVYSLNRILDDQVASPGSWIFKNRVRNENPFEATSDTELKVHLIKPFRPMLGVFAMQYCAVVPKEAIDKYGKDFRANPVGTGPFVFTKWIENQALILGKNEKYFEKGLPKVDGVRVNFMGDRNTGYLEFTKQKINFISGLEASFVDQLLSKEGEILEAQKSKVDFYKAPFLNSEYLGINLAQTDKSPLKNKYVRQALNFAIDREKMLRSLRNNVGKAANAGFVPRGLPSFNDKEVKGYSFDVPQARKLLAKAGYPDGKGFPEITLTTGTDYQDICTFVAKQWEDIGIPVKIDIMQSSTLRELMRKGQVSFFRASWIADYADAENFFSVFYGKNSAPPNYTHFKNDEFDRLYETALNENDDQKRFDLYHQMDRILIEEAPVVFLFYDETARFSHKNVKGYTNNAVNLLKIKRIEID